MSASHILGNLPQELPEGTDPRLVRKHASLKLKIQTNHEREKELAQKYNVELVELQAAFMRVELFIDVVIGVNTEARIDFETLWQNKVAEAIENAFAEASAFRRRQDLQIVQALQKNDKIIIPRPEV